MKVFYATIYLLADSHAGAQGETHMAWVQVYLGIRGAGNLVSGS